MPIRVRCECGQKLKAPDAFAGRRVRCPSCKAEVPIPVPEVETDAGSSPFPLSPWPAGPSPTSPGPESAGGPTPFPPGADRGPPDAPSPGPSLPGPIEAAPPPPASVPDSEPEPADPMRRDWPDELPAPPRADADADAESLSQPPPAPGTDDLSPSRDDPGLAAVSPSPFGPQEEPEPDDGPRTIAPPPTPAPTSEGPDEADRPVVPTPASGDHEDQDQDQVPPPFPVDPEPGWSWDDPLDEPRSPAPLPIPTPEPGPGSGPGPGADWSMADTGPGPEPWSEPEAMAFSWEEEGSGPMLWEPARSDEGLEADPFAPSLPDEPAGTRGPGPGSGEPDRTEHDAPPAGPGLPETEASRPAASPMPGPEPSPTEELRPAPQDPGLSETEASRPAFPRPGPEPSATEEVGPAFPAPGPDRPWGSGASSPGPMPEMSTIGGEEESDPAAPRPVDRSTGGEFPEPGSGAVPEAGSSLTDPFIPSSWDDPAPRLPSPAAPWEAEAEAEPIREDDGEVSVRMPPELVDLMDSTSWGFAARLPDPSVEVSAGPGLPQLLTSQPAQARRPRPEAPARPSRPALIREVSPRPRGRSRKGRGRGWAWILLAAGLAGSAGVVGLVIRAGGGRTPSGPPSPPTRAAPREALADASPRRGNQDGPRPASFLAGSKPAPGPVGFSGPPGPRRVSAAGLVGPNLLLNPGFEESEALEGPPAGRAEFPGWERLGSVAVRSFETAPAELIAAIGDPDLGRSYVLGGLPRPGAEARTILRQAVDLSGLADRIDSGGIRVVASAWLGGVDQTRSFSPNDRAVLTVRFLDESLAELPDAPLTLGPIDDGFLQSAAAPVGTRRMTFVSGSSPVPAGTRAVAVELAFERRAGEVIDAMADGLRLVLEAAP